MSHRHDNPFRDVLGRAVSGQRSLVSPDGLAKITGSANTYVAFSTAPDSVALDGSGANSPFTAALVKHIGALASLSEVMRRVRRDVIDATEGRQTPWDQSSLIDELVLMTG